MAGNSSRSTRPAAREAGAERGARAERLAARWLGRQGLRLIARNARCRCGEIDLVMEGSDVPVFVNVRYRAREDYGGAVASVPVAKRPRMERAIRGYAAAHPAVGRRPLRADVVAVLAGDRIDWIRNAVEGAG